MSPALRALRRVAVGLSYLLAAAGSLIVLVQAFWISYGVFMRYVMNAPDRYVTEATALLLVPVAFAGLGYALMTDAYPRVTLLVERFPARVQRGFDILNLAIMIGVGVFFALSACNATLRAYTSGSTSEVLSWPRVYFWAPVAVALIGFNLYAMVNLIERVARLARGDDTPVARHQG